MAKGIGSLFVEYRATADKFLADLKQMGRDAKEFDRTIAPLRQQALNIGTAMSVVGGAVSGAFIAMARQAANYGDQIRDASIRTGISTEALSGLKFAAEQTGTSFEGVTGSLLRMSRSAFSAAEGSKQGARGFNALGISVKDSSGQLKSQDVLLGEVADSFSRMKDGTEKAAAAQLLFGRNGASMVEFLNQGKKGIEDFKKSAEELGLLIGPKFAAQADEFNDSLNKLQNAQLGLSVTIGSVVLPALNKVIDLTIGGVVAFRKFTEAHPELVRGVFMLSAALVGSGGLIVGLAGVLAILPALTAAFTLLAGPVGIAALAVAGFVSAMVAFPKFREPVLNVLHDVVQAVAFLGSYLSSLGDTVWKLATGRWREAWNVFSTSVDRGFQSAADAGNAFDDLRKSVGEIANFKASDFDFKKLFGDMNLNLDSTGKAAKATRDEIKELTQSFISTIRPADELSAKLQVLLARFDERDVIRAYRDEIIETATAQRSFGGAISASMEKLEQQALAMKRAADIIKDNRESVLEDIKLPKTPDFLNLAPIVPPIDLSRDLEALDMAVKGLGDTTQDTARKSAELFAARQKDTERDISLSKKWQQAWATAMGNISSQFADNVVNTFFSKSKDQTESLEKQITSMKREAEKERLQNAIDSAGKTSKSRSDAVKAMAAFEARIRQEDALDREKNLSKLEGELAYQKNLFARFANGVKNIFAELGKAILKTMLSEVFNKVAKAFSDMLGEMLKSLGSWIKQALSETAKASVTKGASSAAGGAAASGAASSGGGGGGGLGGDPVTWGLLAVNALVTAFAGRGRQQRTEENTRETRDWLELMATAWNPLFHQDTFYLKGIYETLKSPGSISTNGRVTSSMNAVSPSMATMPTNVTIEFSANPTINIDGTGLTPLQIRDEVAPELTTLLETGVRGIRERWAQIFAHSQSVGTPAPTF